MTDKITEFKWKRPDFIEYPKVWKRFKARDLNSDRLIEYRIEDLVESRAKDAFKHMKDNYIKDEPIGQALGIDEDVDYFSDYISQWKSILEQRTPLVCFKEGSDEIIGINWICILTEDDENHCENIKSMATRIILTKISDLLYKDFDPFEHYDVNEYLGSVGLSVDQKYRGRGIGVQFLITRNIVCQEFNIKLSHSIFSSDFSNRNAEKAGFKTDCSISFDDIRSKLSAFSLPVVKSTILTAKSLIIKRNDNFIWRNYDGSQSTYIKKGKFHFNMSLLIYFILFLIGSLHISLRTGDNEYSLNNSQIDPF